MSCAIVLENHKINVGFLRYFLDGLENDDEVKIEVVRREQITSLAQWSVDNEEGKLTFTIWV
jgi:hypothetical protein